MRRILIAAAALCGIATAADFWQAKPPDAWTEAEARKLLTKSPWAAKEPQEKRSKSTETVETRPPVVPPRTKKGEPRPARTKTRKRNEWARIADTQIRWDSATPVLAATAQVDPKWTKALESVVKEYYVVSVVGLYLPDEFATPTAAAAELKRRSALRLGDRVLKPALVRAVDSGTGMFFAIEFPRDGSLEEWTKSIEFETHVGTTRVRHSFEPKQMAFQGRPAL